jgi:cytochrome c oxidase assembly factor CtaG
MVHDRNYVFQGIVSQQSEEGQALKVENSPNVIVRRIMRRGMILLGLSSAVIISMLTPLEPIDYLFAFLSASLNFAPLGLIMVSDVLLLIAGYWLASSLNAFLMAGSLLSTFLARLYSLSSRLNKLCNRKGLVSLIVAMLTIAVWYVPAILNAVFLEFGLHILMHVSLLFAGVLIFVGFRQLSPNMRLFSYLLGCKGMAIFGAYLLVSPVVLYPYFPYAEQAEAGAAMVAMCVASDATIIPLWLRRYFSGK